MQNADIFQYSDYRSFLKNYAKVKKEVSPQWTLGMWAKRLDLKATTSLTMILNGQRHPGPKIVERFSEYFHFNKREKQFFSDLILLNKIKNDSRLKLLIMQELKKLSPNKSFQLLDEKTFSAISNWYFYCIRQMTKLQEFHEEPEWLKRHIHFLLSEKQIRSSIETLLDLQLLKRSEHGVLEISKAQLQTSQDVESEAIKQFHEQMLENAKIALRKTAVNKREFSGLTVTIKKEKINQAKELLRNFVDEFEKLMIEEKGDAVYQLNMQFFPLAEIETKTK
ncbi:MAG: TIGR02147 family protein [Bdellovibrionales bacterium]